jgi:hypothetical protein
MDKVEELVWEQMNRHLVRGRVPSQETIESVLLGVARGLRAKFPAGPSLWSLRYVPEGDFVEVEFRDLPVPGPMKKIVERFRLEYLKDRPS